MSNEENTTQVQNEDAPNDEQNSSILTGDQQVNDQSGNDAPADKADVNDAEGETPSDQEAGGDDQASPETYSDFTLPEGVEMDENLLKEAQPIFEEAGLSHDQAQKFVDLHAKMVQEGARQQAEQFSELVNGWQEQAMADKEFGGDDFNENIGVAREAVEKLGTPEFKQLMEDHGVGNHPEMIRFMWNVGKMLKEDVPGLPGSQTSTPKDAVSIMYPNG